MTRIRGDSVEAIQFRPNDTAPTRAQKLELIRGAVLNLINAENAEEEPVEAPTNDDGLLQEDRYIIPGHFTYPWDSTTLHLHSVVENVYLPADFTGSEAAIGIPPDDEYVLTIYRNPTFTGLAISGGEVAGTLTYADDGSVTWATANGEPVQFYDGDVLGVQGPEADPSAALGSFTFYAQLGVIANMELFTGDVQTGDVIVMLSGDQAGGFVGLSGDQKYG